MNSRYGKFFTQLSHIVYVVVILFVLSSANIAVAEGENHADSDHGAEHYHKNHFAIFTGVTAAENHDDIYENPHFTIGLDYERRLGQVLGVGLLADLVVDANRELLIGVPLFFHVGKHAKLQLAPGWHKVKENQETGLVVRTGFIWDFEVGKNTISPSLFYDISEHEHIFVFGISLGKGW